MFGDGGILSKSPTHTGGNKQFIHEFDMKKRELRMSS